MLDITTTSIIIKSLNNVKRDVLRTVARLRAASKSEVQRELGIRFNTVGEAVDALAVEGYLAVTDPPKLCDAGPGRPPQYFCIADQPHRLLGVALRRGSVEVAITDLNGQLISPIQSGRVPTGRSRPEVSAIKSAEVMIQKILVRNQVLGVGLGVTGLIDRDAGSLLFSSALAENKTASLSPLLGAIKDCPLTVDNHVNVLGELYRHTAKEADDMEVLLVSLGDGELGASMMLKGPPNEGVVVSANEIGHTTFPIKTERCYCGQVGCAERLLSTRFLHRLDPAETRSLEEALAQIPLTPACLEVYEHTTRVIANFTQFIRPHRVVLTGPLIQQEMVFRVIQAGIHERLMPTLTDRVQIVRWVPDQREPAVLAARLAFGELSGQRRRVSFSSSIPEPG